MVQHKVFTEDTKIPVYFADPHSPWQRGTCENTNGLIRDFFPKGTDFSKVTYEEIKHVQDMLNERVRKTLNWKSPEYMFNKLIGAIKT
jgi:IS30 family transposase